MCFSTLYSIYCCCRKILWRPGGRPPSQATSTPTPLVGCGQASPMRVSWLASCATDAARSHSLNSPLSMVLVSEIKTCRFPSVHVEILTEMLLPLPSGKNRGRDDPAASAGRHFRIGDRNHFKQLRCVVDVSLVHHLRLQGGVWAQWGWDWPKDAE